jgi:hypothetical protein
MGAVATVRGGDHLHHARVPPRVREAENTDFLLGLVLAGRGTALETADTAAREPRLAWRPLTRTPLHRRTEAVRPAHAPHPAAAAFAEAAARVLAAPPADGQALALPREQRPWSRVYGEGPITLPG